MRLRRPRTIEQAVQEVLRWKWASDPEQVDLLRGMEDDDLCSLHFSLGLSIRNGLGLWDERSKLLAACGCDHPDDASGVILSAIRDHLVRTASPEDLRRSREAVALRKAEVRRRRRQACEKDAAITSRRCPECGVPCPRYRQTCKFCGFEIGRETL